MIAYFGGYGFIEDMAQVVPTHFTLDPYLIPTSVLCLDTCRP